MRRTKKYLALLMVIIMCFTMFPVVSERKVQAAEVGVEDSASETLRFTGETEYTFETLLNAGNMVEFTPTETGTYYFYTVGNHDTQGMFYLNDELLVNADDDMDMNFFIRYKCIAGETYNLRVISMESDSNNVSFVISKTHPLGEEEALEFTGETNHTLRLLSMSSQYVEFTPEESGTYYFYTEGVDNAYTYATLYQNGEELKCADYDEDTGHFRMEYDCQAGTTYILKIAAENSRTDISFIIEKKSTGIDYDNYVTLATDVKLGATEEIVLNGEYLYRKFTPTAADTYYIYVNEKGYNDMGTYADTEGYLLDGEGNALTGGPIYLGPSCASEYLEYPCEADKTYYVAIRIKDGKDWSCNTKLIISTEHPTEIDFDGYKEVAVETKLDEKEEIALTDECIYRKITITENNTYYITVDCGRNYGAYGYLLNENDEIMNHGYVSNYNNEGFMGYQLDAGTYYVAIRKEYVVELPENVTPTLMISAKHPSGLDLDNLDAVDSSLELETETPLNVTGEYIYKKVVVPADESVYAYTTGDADTCIYIIDSNKSIVDWDDNSGEGFNCQARWWEEYGEISTYYIAIRLTDKSATEEETTTLVVSQTPPNFVDFDKCKTEAVDIAFDAETELSLTDSCTYLKFIVTDQTKAYFYSMSEDGDETAAYLIDASGNIIESYQGNSYLYNTELNAGDVYYLAVRRNDTTSTDAIRIPVMLSAFEPYQAGKDSPYLNLNKLENITLQFDEYMAIEGVPTDLVYAGVWGEINGYSYYFGTDSSTMSELTSKDAVITGNSFLLEDSVEGSTNVQVTAKVTIGEKEFDAVGTVTVRSFLYAEKTKYILTSAGVKLPRCKQNAVGYNEEYGCVEWIVNELPNTYTVTYAAYDSTMNVSTAVTVDEQGNVSKSSTAQNGDLAIIKATYTDGTSTYYMDYYITIFCESELPFDKPSLDGEAINVYSWNSEVGSIIETFKEMYPEYADKIQVVNLGLGATSQEYLEQIEAAIAKKDSASPDIVAWDCDMLPSGLEKEYFVNLEDIGFTDDFYTQSFDFVKQAGMKDGKLKAVSWQASPGAFCYRTDIAEQVFGDASPDTIQEKVKDWDTFIATAEELKVAGYKMVSGLSDIQYPALNGQKAAWVNNNTLYADETLVNYLSLAKELYDGGYTDNTMTWDDQWVENFQQDVFGYFGCTWFLAWTIYGNNGQWAICEGPADYYWGGSYLLATNVGHNNDLTKMLLYVLTCDETFQSDLFDRDFVNNKKVVKDTIDKDAIWFLGDGELLDSRYTKDVLPTFYNVAMGTSMGIRTSYDIYLKGELLNVIDEWTDTMEVDAALQKWVDYVKVKYPAFTYGGVVEIAPPHTHAFGEWIVTKDAGYQVAGEKERVCSCGEKETEVIPALTVCTHSYGDWTVTKDAAYKVEGSKQRTCSICGHVDIEVIPALTVCTHSYGEWVVTKEAGYKTSGEKQRTCSICGHIDTEKIPGLTVCTHNYGDWVVEVEAQCNKEGLKSRTCSICGHKIEKAIPETGFVKGGEFEKGDNEYKIKDPKKKKIVFEGTIEDEKKVKIPKKVKIDGKTYTVVEIAEDAFKDNMDVTTVTIESTITKIGKNAFNGCKKLKKITIKGTALTTISEGAFKNCISLTKIQIPKNVKTIGKEAFYGCKKLKNIVVDTKKLTTKTVGKNAFKGIYEKAKFDVPSSKKKDYQKLFRAKGAGKKTIYK